MEVIIGTYEEFLIGYTLKRKNNQYFLEQSFTNHAHCGSIRSIASSSKYLASGSTDEVIYLINVKHRIETGSLNAHSGTITCVKFLRSAYLFSASEDGNICIWNSRKWICEKILRGHSGAVTSFDFHGSGKLLISVSRDRTLRTWNLIKGRCAYVINLKEVANQVLWSPSCLYFALTFDSRVDIYDLATGAVHQTIDSKHFNKRFNKVLFVDDKNVIVCGDCDELVVYSLETESTVLRFRAHENRIKDMFWANLDSIGGDLLDEDFDKQRFRWLFTTSSDQYIKIWQFDTSDLTCEPALIAKVDSTCRPTCLTVWTANGNYPTQSNFAIPELKISKEELQVCKSKLKEKKSKRKAEPEVVAEEGKFEEEKPAVQPAKKAKPEKPSTDRPKMEGVIEFADDDDDDDVEAIRAMKMTNRKNLKQKHNKRNITTFKQRMMKRRTTNGGGGGGEFRVTKNKSNNKALEASGSKRKRLSNGGSKFKRRK